MTLKKRIHAHELPSWPKVRREIRKLFRGDLCREYIKTPVAGDDRIYCATCGRTEDIHWLRMLDEALTAAEKETP